MIDDKPVVVGYDSSPDAVRALRWGADEAGRLGRPLRVVVARGDLYTVSKWAADWTYGLASEWCVEAEKELTELGVTDAETVVRDGLPSAALSAESEVASLVVLGSRGHGAVADLLGSVSQHVA